MPAAHGAAYPGGDLPGIRGTGFRGGPRLPINGRQTSHVPPDLSTSALATPTCTTSQYDNPHSHSWITVDTVKE
ncbi:hypothetical protein OH690_01095 [Escherichia coli]|nr:hypothetical protein [Escherichia coli]